MGEPKAVPIASLNLEQLSSIKEQLEQEARILSSSLGKLKMANSKFLETKQTLEEFNSENKGTEMLTPLTSSLYVRGTLASIDSVIVDVGTGYFVQKDINQAQEFVDRKIKLVQDNLYEVSDALGVKRKNLESIVSVMQEKMQQGATPS
eukprot:TRINITY_DN5217_c0_g1_i1.p1 TRINITY_DN5217_c0_g1~~TRINITY_DN5217_c0_g1_i1.p1  ORF type:complete len:168 (+),score=43.00 TRINITY_DN5217_c0_g1_i1:60-506(+)